MTRDATTDIQVEMKPPFARDAVCGMQVAPEHAKGQTEYEGETYYFCSEECYRTFSERPEMFASEGRGSGRRRAPWSDRTA